jgi:hypothetical protein
VGLRHFDNIKDQAEGLSVLHKVDGYSNESFVIQRRPGIHRKIEIALIVLLAQGEFLVWSTLSLTYLQHPCNLFACLRKNELDVV